MSLNSIKILTLSMALLAAVACGKDNRNKLNRGTNLNKVNKIKANEDQNLMIDGQYKLTNDRNLLELADIKGNVVINYLFSVDKKSVEVTKQRLTIKGSQLIKTQDIENKCRELTTSTNVFELAKNENNTELLFLDSSNVEEKEDAIVVASYKLITKEEFDNLISGVLSQSVARVCLDENGKAAQAIDGTETKDLIHTEDETTTQEETEGAADAGATTDDSTAETVDAAAKTDEKTAASDAATQEEATTEVGTATTSAASEAVQAGTAAAAAVGAATARSQQAIDASVAQPVVNRHSFGPQ